MNHIPVLETAGRTVAKCDQTLVWPTKFIPKDRPENEFGWPNLGRGYCMFPANLRSIAKINPFKIAQRTWGNNVVFLPKDATIILNDLSRFSAMCCLFLFSKKPFSRTRLTSYKSIRMYRDETKWSEMCRTIDFTVKDCWDSDRLINHPIEWVSDLVGRCGVSTWVDVGERVDVIDWFNKWVG